MAWLLFVFINPGTLVILLMLLEWLLTPSNRHRIALFERLARKYGLRHDATRNAIPESVQQALPRFPKNQFTAIDQRLSGTIEGQEITIIDCHDDSHYSTCRKTDPVEGELHQDESTLFTCRLPRSLRHLELIPNDYDPLTIERTFTLADPLQQVELESAEFNRAYHVHCGSRRFAWDVCHPRMMEFLLDELDRPVVIDGDRLAIYIPYWPSAKRMGHYLHLLLKLRDLIPERLVDTSPTKARQAMKFVYG